MKRYKLFLDTRQTKRSNRFNLWNPKTRRTIYVDNDGSELFERLKNEFGNIELTLDEINYLFSIRVK